MGTMGKKIKIKLPAVLDLRGHPELSEKSSKGTLTEKDIESVLKDQGREIEYEEVEERRHQKTNIPTSLRWTVWERDNFTCKNCGVRRYLTVDHIRPESKGGKTDIKNLQTLCKSCNSKKGTK